MNNIPEEIIIVENFLSNEECLELLNEAYTANEDKWFIKVNNVGVLKSRNHKLMLQIKKTLSYFFDSPYQFDLVQAIHKTDKTCIWEPHADNNGGKEIQYGIIIYLNDDYEGGELNYLNLNFSIKPKPGMLVIHPADEKHKHEVKQVISGDRYAVTTFVRDMTVIK